MENDFSNIAVLIDVENISSEFLKKTLESVAAYGHISVKRIYADWTDNKLNSWKKLIHEYSLVTIQQFSVVESKNTSDFTLVIDAMDLLHQDIFDCFCIVSSDSDFTRLVQRIKESGKTVIGVGEKKAKLPFVQACNNFIYLNDDKNSSEKSLLPQGTEIIGEKEETFDSLMGKAVENLSDQDGWVQMNRIVPYLKQIKSDFDLQTQGIKRISQYYKNHSNIYELKKDNTMVRRK
jgi:uncharacterized protein (TIGR00288 family)